MKKSIVLLALLFITMFSFAQTSNEVKEIKKKGGSIVNVETGEKLSKYNLKSILDEEAYDNYAKGRKQRIASYTFWGYSATCAVTSTLLFVEANSLANDCIDNHNHTHEFESGAFCNNGNLAFWLIGGMMATGAVIYAIPATVLTITSNKNINEAVDSFNQKTSDVTLNFGATNNGIGFTLKF